MPPPLVGVFGGSEVTSSEPLYHQAVRLGQRLAGAGFGLCTGGYGGIMEAVSRGAREAGAGPVGVTCSEFGAHPANRWVAREIREPTLLARTWRLIDLSAAFIIFPGKAGTLAELALLLALERAGLLAGKPRIFLGPIWRDLLSALERTGFLEPGESERETIVAGTEAAVRSLQQSMATSP
jgi:uncharacterized protein (TIGR00730 family)